MERQQNVENSLVIFTKASQMLAEANTIQKAKELKDLALTAADWAKRKKMGDEAVQYAQSYALRAERKMGEMLRSTELAKGGRPYRSTPANREETENLTGNHGVPVKNTLLTLAKLGLTKKESSRAQFVASLPEEKFKEIETGKVTIPKAIKEIRKQELETQRRELVEKAKEIEPDKRWNVQVADIHSYQTNKKFDFIITDPPYPKEYLELYETLAQRALEWLKPNGLLCAMCGQSYLDQIIISMGKYLQYYWTGCYLLPKQPTPLRQRQVNTNWKPILIFTLPNQKYGGKIFGDRWESDVSDKNLHEWQQSESGMSSIIKQVCLPGQSIFDPFCGTGTTGVAALQHGCLFEGIDINKDNVGIAKTRLGDIR